MAFDKDAFLTALDSMTVLELNDLVKAIEEKFGVSAAAMAAPAAAGAGAGAAAAEEKTEFNVVLTDAGEAIKQVDQMVHGGSSVVQKAALRRPLFDVANLTPFRSNCMWISHQK